MHFLLLIAFGGCNSLLQLDCLQTNGFNEGSIPFRYIRVPITANRLSKIECKAIVGKIMAKVKLGSLKSISYVSRAMLITTIRFECKGLADVKILAWNKACIAKLVKAIALEKDLLWLIGCMGDISSPKIGGPLYQAMNLVGTRKSYVKSRKISRNNVLGSIDGNRQSKKTKMVQKHMASS
ncbi:hypothetical protein Cgig2_021014 [Carnegiea gigantea]|uniref:Uncharacterized protein n=1 Tax=Carnegiea gigantea TaxID=171969 RepID=A0A9Q1JXH2_9CARY|nr:hypothetical protein Cgig2_021014 [Carnegiea gigantea]